MHVLAFSSQKQVRCDAGQSQGSWRVICTWFYNVPVFGTKVTRYTFSLAKPLTNNFIISFIHAAHLLLHAAEVLLLSSSTRRRFYPQRSSGQAVVTGVVSCLPPGTCLHLSRIGFSIPTSRRFSSNVANSLSRFPLIDFYAIKKKSLRVCALGEN